MYFVCQLGDEEHVNAFINQAVKSCGQNKPSVDESIKRGLIGRCYAPLHRRSHVGHLILQKQLDPIMLFLHHMRSISSFGFYMCSRSN